MPLNKKYKPLLISIGMGITIGFAMSLIMTYISIGLNDKFLLTWAKSFIVGICVGVPVSLLAAPFINKMVDVVITKE